MQQKNRKKNQTKRSAQPGPKIGGRTWKEWEKQARANFRHIIGAQKDCGLDPDQDYYEMSDEKLNRRLDSMRKYLKYVIERYREKTGCLSEEDIGSFWIDSNTFTYTYPKMNLQYYILTGAAIWMLDRITKDPEWEKKLLPYLPDRETFRRHSRERTYRDSLYDTDLIESLVYVLRYRNFDPVPEKKEDLGATMVYDLTDRATALNQQHADTPSRRNFDAVMALISPEEAEKAAAHFETYFWEWTDAVYDVLDELHGSVLILKNELERTEKLFKQKTLQQEQLLDRMQEKYPKHEIIKQTRKPIPFAVMTNCQPKIEDANYDTPFDAMSGVHTSFRSMDSEMEMTYLEYQQVNESTRELAENFDILLDSLREKEDEIAYFTIGYQGYEGDIESENYELVDRELLMMMKPPEITDPYEICFALVRLLDSGSDLPWLYGPAIGVIKEAGKRLPWARMKEIWNEPSRWDPDPVPAAETSADGAGGEERAEIPDVLKLCYAPEGDESEKPYSFAQIFYLETGCILPRDMHRFDGRSERLKGYGLNEEETSRMLMMMNASFNCLRKKARNLDGEYMAALRRSLEPDGDALQTEGNGSGTENSKPEKTREELEEEVRNLRKALYESERNNRETVQKLEEQKSTSAMEHRELADLREAFFLLENPDEAETQVKTEIRLPYEVKKNTVIIGGREGSESSLRQLLKGNVRYILKDRNYDPSILRGADVIWIQSGFLSHSFFYKMIDAARSYRVPVRYFAGSGAERCALQVAENDRET